MVLGICNKYVEEKKLLFYWNYEVHGTKLSPLII